MKKTIQFSLLLIALPLLLTSCSDTIDDLLSTGQFDSEITGSLTKSFNGVAGFTHAIVTTSGAEGSLLGFEFTDPNNTDEMIVISVSEIGNTTGIAPGTYSYSPPDPNLTVVFTASYSDGTTQGYPYLVFNKTNEVVISSVTNTLIKGTFEINLATDVQGSNPITIIGNFSAVGVTTTQ